MLRKRQKVGKYRIVGRISRGPLAEVYAAHDTIQNIRVALKIPKQTEDVGDDEILHEVRVATKLQHPNILSVLNASYIDDYFVIAMELGSESLAERLRLTSWESVASASFSIVIVPSGGVVSTLKGPICLIVLTLPALSTVRMWK